MALAAAADARLALAAASAALAAANAASAAFSASAAASATPRFLGSTPNSDAYRHADHLTPTTQHQYYPQVVFLVGGRKVVAARQELGVWVNLMARGLVSGLSEMASSVHVGVSLEGTAARVVVGRRCYEETVAKTPTPTSPTMTSTTTATTTATTTGSPQPQAPPRPTPAFPAVLLSVTDQLCEILGRAQRRVNQRWLGTPLALKCGAWDGVWVGRGLTCHQPNTA